MSDHEERREAEEVRKLVEAERILTSPRTLDDMRIYAEYRRQRYLAYVKAGFTSGQALYLCTTV